MAIIRKRCTVILFVIGVLFVSVGFAIAENIMCWRKVIDPRSVAVDETGKNMGVYVNNPLLKKDVGALAGEPDSAVHFNGKNQNIRIPIDTTQIKKIGLLLNRFTVEFWYKSSSANNGKCLMGTINKGLHRTCFQIEINKAGLWGVLIRSEDGKLLLSNANSTVSKKLSDGSYHHIVWVISNASKGKVSLYVDGQAVPVTTKGATSTKFAKFQYDLAIGATDDRSLFKQFINATLDEVAIYTSVLDKSRIAAHYASGVGKAKLKYTKQILANNPFAYWRLGESSDEGLYLLLDNRIIEKTANANLRVGKVVKYKGNPLFGQQYPWEVMYNNMYPNVIYDEQEKIYKIWYGLFIYDSAYANIPPEKRKHGIYMKYSKSRKDGLCYAFSKDGIHWIKPMLNIVKWNGRSSNILSKYVHGVGILKDMIERDPARRYKMFFKGEVISVRFSSDGLHWGQYIACPEIAAAGDTHNNALWVPELKKYVGFTRLWNNNRRVVGRTESLDFVHWTKAVEVFRGRHLFDIYSLPVFRYAGVYVAFPAIFDERADRVRTELAWSPDTIHWYRIDEGSPLIPNSEKKGDYDWGTIFASKPVIRNNKIQIYYGGCNGGHFDWRDGFLCLATLRLDGFAGYEPADSSKEGLVITKPISFSATLRITADADGGKILVSLLDKAGNVILTSQPITGNVTDELVKWKDKVKLKKVVGKKVRIRFTMKRAKIYSFRL